MDILTTCHSCKVAEGVTSRSTRSKLRGIRPSAIESAKANDLEPLAYLSHILKALPYADTVEKLELLLPWSIKASGALSKNE